MKKLTSHSKALAVWGATLVLAGSTSLALAADAAASAGTAVMPAAAATSSTAGAPSSTASRPANDPVEQRIATLHSQLAITSDQESKWSTFAQSMRENADTMRDAFAKRAHDVKTMNAADNMQSWAMIAQAHAQAMQKLATSFSDLYASFSAEQKTKADELFRARMQKHMKEHHKHQKSSTSMP